MDTQLKTYLGTLEAHQGYAENTRQAYANDLFQFYEYLKINLGRKPRVSDFTLEVTKKFLEAERKSGMKPSTLHRRRVSLKRFAQYLSDQGFGESDLVETISQLQENLWREISKQKLACLTNKEVERLLKTVRMSNNPRSHRDLAILSILLEIGMSIGALVSLNLSDINLREFRIRIGFSNEKESRVSIPKSSGLIRKYLDEGRPELTQSLSEEALFVSQLGGRISRQGIWQVLRIWGRRAKIRKNLSPRLLRHTAVKRMIIEGKSLEEIQKFLGHGNQLSTRSLVRRVRKACGVS
jgi:integrase/recombinase XerD